MIRLSIVHEQRIVADLIAAVLRLEADIEVVDQVCTIADALTLCQHVVCDIILVSGGLPRGDIEMLTQTLQKYQPIAKVLMTGLIDSNALIVHCFEDGATGYVLKDDSCAVLAQKIRMAWRAEWLVTPALTRVLMAQLYELKQKVRELYRLQAMNPAALYGRLTEREGAVLALLEQGYTNLQIAATLSIEEGTVKHHVHNLLHKFGVTTRSKAALLAHQAVTH